MSPITRHGETFRPPRPTPDSTPTRSATPSLKVTGGALAIVLIVNALGFLVYWIPELQALPLVGAVIWQISPLMSPVVSGGAPVPGTGAGAAGFATAMLLITIVTWFLARERNELLRLSLPILGALQTVVAGVLLLLWLPNGRLEGVATGLVLLAVLLVLGIRTVTSVQNVAVRDLPDTRTTAGGWLTPYLVTLLGPFAVGRMLVYGPARDSLAAMARCPAYWGPVVAPTYASVSTVLIVATGAAGGLLVWSVIRLLPPWKGRKLTSAIVALVLAVGPGLAMARPAAISASADITPLIQQQAASLASSPCSGW